MADDVNYAAPSMVIFDHFPAALCPPSPPFLCAAPANRKKKRVNFKGSSQVQPRMPPHHVQNFNNLYNIHGIVLIICIAAPSSIICTFNTSISHLSSNGFDIEEWLQRFRTNKGIPL